jgi:UPF0176 protein
VTRPAPTHSAHPILKRSILKRPILKRPILNVAFYRFVALKELRALRKQVHSICADHGLKGTILLSAEGINGFLAGAETELRGALQKLSQIPGFSDLEPKESWSDTIPFEFLLVKLKKEIISMGRGEIQPQLRTAPRMTPQELKKLLDEGRPVTLVDTRNDYEFQLGTFKDALTFDLKTFRKFPEQLAGLAPSLQTESAPVVMFCTGGIRCEKATALALDLGMDNVFQLEGGILKYFEECGGAHYQGDCFVFDHRVALRPDLTYPEDLVLCIRCRTPFKAQASAACPKCGGRPQGA